LFERSRQQLQLHQHLSSYHQCRQSGLDVCVDVLAAPFSSSDCDVPGNDECLLHSSSTAHITVPYEGVLLQMLLRSTRCPCTAPLGSTDLSLHTAACGMLSLSPLHDIYQQDCTRCESHTLSVRTACKHPRHDSRAHTLLVYWDRVTTSDISPYLPTEGHQAYQVCVPPVYQR